MRSRMPLYMPGSMKRSSAFRLRLTRRINCLLTHSVYESMCGHPFRASHKDQSQNRCCSHQPCDGECQRVVSEMIVHGARSDWPDRTTDVNQGPVQGSDGAESLAAE